MRSVRRFAGFGLRRRSWRSRSDGLDEPRRGKARDRRPSRSSDASIALSALARTLRGPLFLERAAAAAAGRAFETESALRRGAARRGRRRPPEADVRVRVFPARRSRGSGRRAASPGGDVASRVQRAPTFPGRARARSGKPSSLRVGHDPQPGVVQEQYPGTAMCVRNVDVHVSCSSQVDAQLAAFFIDPRAK